MQLSLDSSIQEIHRIGDATTQKLDRLGIHTVRDLLYHIPFRYEDYRQEKKIADLEVGEETTIRASVQSITKFSGKRRITIVKAVIADDSGKIDVTWFNQPYLLMTLRKGSEWFFTGKVGLFNKRKTLNAPSIESTNQEKRLHSGRLVPIYPQTEGVSSRMLRRYIAETLDEVHDFREILPQEIRDTKHLPGIEETLRGLHFPEDEASIDIYHHRLAFEEIYSLLFAAKQQKEKLRSEKVVHKLSVDLAQEKVFEKALPFSLSPSQRSTVLELSLDLVQTHPARRLIQGEVGSGKTIVAAFGFFCASSNNAASVFIAPTQILAQQHRDTLTPIFNKLHIPVVFVTSTSKLPKQFESNTVFIGTHALFEHVKQIKPAVVVVDEEHRFGVEQRNSFWNVAKKPHMFTMTATPIPRTVAQTVLANQDVSYLDEIPEKKKKISTRVVNKEKRTAAYTWIDEHIANGEQVFVVCPFIEQSNEETLANVKSATQTFEETQRIFPNRRVALLHGKVAKDEREKVLERMRAKKLDILVATSIIEVGIDIPEATIIVIEGAERFGLAQLHQLRGRVGRAGQQAYCLLFTSEGVEDTPRLRIMEKENNGNILAEFDLKLRGTGELLGTRQHGFDTLKFASWFDEKLIQECKELLDT